jgi:hypothetical protein
MIGKQDQGGPGLRFILYFSIKKLFPRDPCNRLSPIMNKPQFESLDQLAEATDRGLVSGLFPFRF